MKISLKQSLFVCMVYVGTIFSAPGDLDTTANGGTGFGNATPASATGYVVAGFGNNMNLNGSAIQPDGKIVVCGSDLTTGEAIVARYNINGTEDTTFGSFYALINIGIADIAYGVAIQNDGKIVVCGTSDSDFFVARFLPNGLYDTVANGGSGFNQAGTPGYIIQSIGTTDAAYAVTINPFNQKIIVTGASDNKILVAQFTTAGALDTGGFNTASGYNIAVNPGAVNIAYAVALDASYNVVIAGKSDNDIIVARYSSAGVLDTAGFNSGGTAGYNIQSFGGTDIAYGVDFQSNGKIIIVGTDGTNAAVARFTTAGVLDTTFGVSSSGYNVANSFSGSSAIAYGVAVQSNDTIVIGGQTIISATEYFAIARYLGDGSALDTSFSTDGYTTSAIDNPSYGRTLSMQSNGSFILAGKVSTGNTTFGTARYLGDAAPQGCMDITYNPAIGTSPGTPGFRTYPTDTTAANEPQVKALQVLSNNSVFVLTENFTTATKSQLVQLDSAGSSTSANAIATIDIAQIGGADVISDSRGRALVVGTNGTPRGWIARYVPTAGTPGSFALDANFNAGSIVVQASSPTTTAYSRVCEQASGNVLAMGQNGSTGIIVAYNQNGTVNTSFGGGDGVYSILNITLTDMIVDTADNIYVIGSVASGNIQLYRILPTGSGLDPSYNTTGIIDTGFASASYQGAKLAGISGWGGTTLVTVNNSTKTFEFLRYNSEGNPDTPAGNSIEQSVHLLNNPVITQLQIDSNNQPIYVGYDDYDFFVGRMNANVTIDTAFAPYSSCPGILKTMYNDNNPTDATTPTRLANCVGISPSGAIVFGGYENITGSTTISTVGNVVGGSSVYELVRYPGALYSGTINTLYGTNGAQDLNTTLSLPAGQAKAINVITAGAQVGKMLVADSNGSSTTIAMLNSAGTALDANAFGTGVSSVVLTGVAQTQTIMVDPTGLIFYILGTDGKVRSLTYGSATVTTFAISTLTAAYGIAQQASGRILVSGYDGTRGVVVSYTPAGVIDTSFNEGGFSGAPAGYWYTDSANPITAISVGTIAAQKDRIYIAYADNGSGLGNAVVRQILENGTSYAPSSGTGAFTPVTTGFSGTVNGNTQVCMQLDVNGAIVLVAATSVSPSAIKGARYNANGTTGGSYGVAAITVIAATANQVIENILTLSDGSTLILAAVPNATPASASMNIARLTSAFALDTVNFNSLGSVPGVLTTNVPSSGSYTSVMSDFYSLDVITAGGIFIAGDNSPTAASAHPYLTQVVNADIVTKVSQSATSLGAAGALDTTFNPAGATPGFMNFNTELQTTVFPTATTVYALLQKSNGMYYVAGSSSTNSYVTLMSDDDVQDVTFGLVTIPGSGKTNASSMLLAQDGNLLVAGAGDGSTGSGWIVSLNPTTGAVIGAFAPTVTLDSHYAIVQQTTGRILVAGVIAGVGTIIAYNSVTGAIDTTFGASGYYTATGYGSINSILLDASDNIYFMANDGSNNAKVVKLVPSGTGAASGWTVPTVTANSTLAINNHLAFNQAGNIIAVAVDTTTPRIVLKTITASSGSASAAFNLASGSTGITTPKVSAIMVDMNTSPGKVILTGFDDQTTDVPFIIRTNTGVTALDTTFNSGGANPGVQPYNTLTSGVTTNWYAGMINANGKITVAGYASALAKPYVMRVYGDDFIGQYVPTVTAGTQGTVNTNFGTAGEILLASLPDASNLATATPKVVIPTATGQYYIALDNPTPPVEGSPITQVVRLTNGGLLDTTFNFGGIPADGFAENLMPGVTDMIIDGTDKLVVIGINAEEAPFFGWISRYVAGDGGTLDPTFNTSGTVSFGSLVLVNKVAQQTLSRYVLAGQLANGNAGLVAVTNSGVIDTTFNSQINPGYYDTGIATSIYALVTDVYDRIIIAYKNGTGIDIRRLTSAGQIDMTFATSGTITGAIADADSVSQVCITFDASGNIVIAAHTSTPAIAVTAYTNTIGTGMVIETQLNITTIITNTPVLTNIIATADNKILLSGYQSGSNSMWVARVKDNGLATYTLDTTFGGGDGIMTFSFDGAATVRLLNGTAIYGDGEIAMVGAETVGGVVTPFLSMAYDNPYTTQTLNSQDSQPIGTNDVTLGASSTTATNLGVTFFASASGDATSGQIARAVALQDDANILVAVDGGLSSGSTTPSDIFLKMFNIDGVANTTFETSGQRTVLTTYQNQYVQDMVTFTTVAGVHKAILAGYTYNSNLPTANQYSSLLLQYNLQTHALDNSFGGFYGSPAGVAFGNGKQINVVGVQSNGRIIAGGQSQDGLGLLLGYTAAGKLDTSFGTGGYVVTSATPSSSIYTHVIDNQNRVVVAYIDEFAQANIARFLADGSGLDTSFAGGVINTLNVTYGDNGIRLAVDASNNVFAAVVDVSYAALTVYSYAAANGATLYAAFTPSLSLTAFLISKLLIDQSGKAIIVGCDTNGGSADQVVIARTNTTLSALDTTFNPSPAAIPGCLKYAVTTGTTQAATDALIHPDGRIIVVGSES